MYLTLLFEINNSMSVHEYHWSTSVYNRS